MDGRSENAGATASRPDASGENLRRCFPHRTARPDARYRLFCFPPAGAGAAVFREWSGLTGPAADVCAFELPGHQTRFNEPLAGSVDEVARQFIDASAPLRDRPFILLGHSLGAMIATQAAQLLVKSGSNPAALVVVGCPAPGMKERNRAIAHLDRPAFLKALAGLGGLPEEVLANRELLDVLLPALRADCRMAEEWRAAADSRFRMPLPCPIGAISGTADPYVTAAELDAWRHHGSRAAVIRRADGDHFFLQSDPEPVLTLVTDLERLSFP
jgi:surfactin synthase thioesterase subunit